MRLASPVSNLPFFTLPFSALVAILLVRRPWHAANMLPVLITRRVLRRIIIIRPVRRRLFKRLMPIKVRLKLLTQIVEISFGNLIRR